MYILLMSVDDAYTPTSVEPVADRGYNTGTDGYVPQPIDKALLGGAPQKVGRFHYRYDTDTWTWSDTVARMHGYEPGQVEPTTELVLSHKHPDDLTKVKGLLKQSPSVAGTASAQSTATSAKSSSSAMRSPTLMDR